VAAIVGNTLPETFPRKFFITLWVSSGRMESISCWILSFKSSREWGLCLKTFSFRYPQRKKSHGHFDRARSGYGMLSESLSQNGCSHNTLQQQSPNVHRSNPLWVLKTVEANQPHDATPTSLPLLQPAQCPLKMWEIFMPNPVCYNSFTSCWKPSWDPSLYISWKLLTLWLAWCDVLSYGGIVAACTVMM
jgi:hypothetical protein